MDPMELMAGADPADAVDPADAADLVLTGASGENERRMNS
jgi:hypothetical protein